MFFLDITYFYTIVDVDSVFYVSCKLLYQLFMYHNCFLSTWYWTWHVLSNIWILDYTQSTWMYNLLTCSISWGGTAKCRFCEQNKYDIWYDIRKNGFWNAVHLYVNVHMYIHHSSTWMLRQIFFILDIYWGVLLFLKPHVLDNSVLIHWQSL
jgi:hypothetical protein